MTIGELFAAVSRGNLPGAGGVIQKNNAEYIVRGVGWIKDKSDIEKRIQNAANVLDEIMAVKDKAIPDKIMADAECIAVVPSMVKIAIGFGGNHGKGVAYAAKALGLRPVICVPSSVDRASSTDPYFFRFRTT